MKAPAHRQPQHPHRRRKKKRTLRGDSDDDCDDDCDGFRADDGDPGPSPPSLRPRNNTSISSSGGGNKKRAVLGCVGGVGSRGPRRGTGNGDGNGYVDEDDDEEEGTGTTFPSSASLSSSSRSSSSSSFGSSRQQELDRDGGGGGDVPPAPAAPVAAVGAILRAGEPPAAAEGGRTATAVSLRYPTAASGGARCDDASSRTGLVFEKGSWHFDSTRLCRERPDRIQCIRDALMMAARTPPPPAAATGENRNEPQRACQDDEESQTQSDRKHRTRRRSQRTTTKVPQSTRTTSSEKGGNGQDDSLYSHCYILMDYEDREEELSSQQQKAYNKKPQPPQQHQNEVLDHLLSKVHVPGYVRRLNRLSDFRCHCDPGAGRQHRGGAAVPGRSPKLEEEESRYDSVYLTPDSFREARKAAASLCELVELVVSGQLHNGFAAIRPPGHHAGRGSAGGYCLVNNVAVAASYARERLGIERVLIVDYDVHHGNGTQQIFVDDPSVLYFSVHRWHGANFYPFGENASGGPRAVGFREGRGYNVNVGWTRSGMGDAEYRAVWDRVLMPIAREFQPGLVLVSAGFDAADGDDVGRCRVTPEGFAGLTKSLRCLAGGRVVCALEGGYVRSVLAKCAVAVVGALLDNKTSPHSQEGEDGVGEDIDPIALKNIRSTIDSHKSYWECFQTDSE